METRIQCRGRDADSHENRIADGYCCANQHGDGMWTTTATVEVYPYPSLELFNIIIIILS